MEGMKDSERESETCMVDEAGLPDTHAFPDVRIRKNVPRCEFQKKVTRCFQATGSVVPLNEEGGNR